MLVLLLFSHFPFHLADENQTPAGRFEGGMGEGRYMEPTSFFIPHPSLESELKLGTTVGQTLL